MRWDVKHTHWHTHTQLPALLYQVHDSLHFLWEWMCGCVPLHFAERRKTKSINTNQGYANIVGKKALCEHLVTTWEEADAMLMSGPLWANDQKWVGEKQEEEVPTAGRFLILCLLDNGQIVRSFLPHSHIGNVNMLTSFLSTVRNFFFFPSFFLTVDTMNRIGGIVITSTRFKIIYYCCEASGSLCVCACVFVFVDTPTYDE